MKFLIEFDVDKEYDDPISKRIELGRLIIEGLRDYLGSYTEILEDELDKFYESQEELGALECHGVDNWEGYSEAMNSIYGEEG